MLIRLSVFPFGASSYFFGITGINTIQYFFGSFTFIFKLSMSIYLGCRLFVIGKKEESTTSEKVVFGLEIFINVFFTILIGIFAKR
jgi:uncharacterized membrane protein YdjX (TVP38/TMEM64 family)